MRACHVELINLLTYLLLRINAVQCVHKNKANYFLSHVSILTRDIDQICLSVRPSVRYVPVLYENGLTYCHSFFHRTVA